MGETTSKAAKGNSAEQETANSSAFKRPREDPNYAISTLLGSQGEEDPLPVASPTAPSPGTVRKKHRMARERICKICGDKAAAHHFDVITCESCKTFFRRNAHKIQKVCQFEGRCQITVNTRRFCPACRLQKCYDIGMRADLIMDEEERKARMEKIRTNRKIRMEAAQKEEEMRCRENNKSPCFICSPDSEGINLILQEPDTALAVESLLADLSGGDSPQGAENQDKKVCVYSSDAQKIHLSCSGGEHVSSSSCEQERHTSLPVLGDLTCDSTCNTDSHQLIPLQNSLTSSDDRSSSRTRGSSGEEGPIQKKTPLFCSVPASLLPTDPGMFWTLTPQEHMIISNLGTVFEKEVVKQYLSVPESLVTQMAQLNFEQSGHMDSFGQEVIRFLKQVPDFSALHVSDNQALLKANGVLIIMCCTSSFYSEQRNAWIKDKGIFTEEIYAMILQDKALAAELHVFSLLLQRIFQKDYEAYGLLLCMTFFDPLAPGVSDRQSVNIFHDKYALLQKHHMESKHSYMFAAQYRDALQEVLRQGKSIAVRVSASASKWITAMNPLTAELFNLT